MKTNSLIKLLVVLILCLSVLFVFTACKDDEIYAGSEDFESYPDYWNGFNDDSGDIYIPEPNGTPGSQDSSSTDDSNTSSEDFTVNFTDDEDEDEKVEDKEENTPSQDVTDTDKDGTPDNTDTDDDNDGTTDDKDPDDDNDGIPDDEEKPDYGNQGPLVFF